MSRSSYEGMILFQFYAVFINIYFAKGTKDAKNNIRHLALVSSTCNE